MRPVHRIDDFPVSMLAKLAEVYAIADKKSVDAVLFLGDFFNNHRIYAYDIINSAMDIICSAKVETHAVIGQHDLVGYNADSYATSTLCFMERHCRQFKTMRSPTDFGDTVVYPCHVWDDFSAMVKGPASKKKKSILAAHHLITRDKKPFDTFVAGEFLPCPYSAVVFGDYHLGMDPYRGAGDTLVWSPGALARLAINDAGRTIKVGILEAKPGQPVEVEEIVLDSVKPDTDVLARTFVEGVREHAGIDASAFVEKILTIESESVDIFDLVGKVASKNGIRKEVVDYIVSKRK